MHANFAYFGGSDAKYIYQLPEGTNLEAFPVTGSGLLGSPKISVDTPIAKWPKYNSSAGGFMSVSSNGSDIATGILWCSGVGQRECFFVGYDPHSGCIRKNY